jgi:4-amino-4-deoxy-L-arabinose transferase-like glycosyltransferase
MSSLSKRLITVGLLGAALIFHVAVIGQDFTVLAENGFLYDDSFYAFKIAKGIADGQGPTFDGVHPTNGFQPLYVFLIAPFYWVFPSDLIAPIYAALAFSALLTALTAFLLYRIVGRYTSAKVAVAAAAIWVFSPVVTRQAANGLETSLAVFLLASIVYFYLSRVRPVEAPRGKDLVVLGVLAGLGVLARVDVVFLALVVALDYLLVLRRRGAAARALRGIFVPLGAALATYSPWLLYNVFVLKSVVQDSGVATRYLSLAYAPLFDLGPAQMASTGPTASFVWGHIAHSFSVLKLAPPVHAFFRGAEKLGVEFGAGSAELLVANVVGLALVALFLYLVVGRKRNLIVKGFGEIQFLLVFAGVLIAAYSLYVFGVFFFARYYYPVYFILCVYAGLLLEEALRRVASGAAAARVVTGAVLAVYLGAFGIMAYTCAAKSYPVYCFYEVAQWVDNNTSPDDTIGVFQSGAIGYFSSRRVVNLDGKVNREALTALKGGRLSDYLRHEGIDVVVDNRTVLELFLTGGVQRKKTADPLVLLGLHPIMEPGAKRVSGWAAYRVNGFASSRETGTPGNGPRALHDE